MADAVFLFVDFDDTLSDSARFAEQYRRELAALLSGEAGGSAEDWAEALAVELPASAARYLGRFGGGPGTGYCAWLAEEWACVAEATFARAGCPLPRAEAPVALARRAQFDALIGVNAAFDGAGEAMRALFEAGVRVQMASSQESQYLLAALMGAGIESYVESKFGPDLVDCAKEGPEFYRRIFEATGIAAGEAIVLDDQVECLRWAQAAGARVVQACIAESGPAPEFPVVLRSLADLPAVARSLAGHT